MIFFDTTKLAENSDVEVLKEVKKRKITHVFHDIDGTHSLIREWQPVMSRVLNDVIVKGLPEGFDSNESVRDMIEHCAVEPLPETDDFCIESAGLSALTQMEWSIRRAVEAGNIPAADLGMSENDLKVNSEIAKRIYKGEELFEEFSEPEKFKSFLRENTPKLFKAYEKVLNGYCRDKNLKLAKENPDKFLVEGSKEFMNMLFKNGAKNYFVTGAVVDVTALKPMGMYEEVLALGFEIGEGKTVEAICGSIWTEKIPKEEVMRRLCRENNINPENVLVVGDGRSEIFAGSEMGAAIISRLPKEAKRQRALHKELGTDVIVEAYSSLSFKELWIFLQKKERGKILSNDEKEKFKREHIAKLTECLPMLRAQAGVTQETVADRVGIARQTYSAIECGKKPMSWNTFMSLILLLRANEKTKDIIKILGIYTEDLENYINMQNQE